MKVETKLFLLLAVYGLAVGTIYGIFSRWDEPVGAVAFYLTGLACLLISGFLWWDRPQNRPAPG